MNTPKGIYNQKVNIWIPPQQDLKLKIQNQQFLLKFIMLQLEKSNCIFRQSKVSNSTLPFEVLKVAENRIPPWRDPKFNLITTVLKLAENRIPWKDPKFNLHFSCQFDHSRRSRNNCGSHYGKIHN